MRANSTTANRPASRLRPAAGWKLRPDALTWIAQAKPDWHNDKGRPVAEVMGPDMGMSRSNIRRMQDDPDWPPASSTTVLLAKGAAAEYGLPYMVAFHRIFRDPSLPKRADNWFGKATAPEDLIAAFIEHVSTFAPANDQAEAVAA